MMRLLTKKGPGLMEAKDSLGRTVLHWLSYYGNHKCLQIFRNLEHTVEVAWRAR